MRRFDILNNYSIRSKLIIIYLMCVLIPMITTDSIIYITIKNNEVKQQKINMEHTVDRVKYNLASVFDDCILVSNHLYNDITLNDFINTKYDSFLDYYEEYNYLLQNNVINYYYNSQHVYQVTIYTDNNTITNSSNFRKLTPEIKNSKWYKEFHENNKDLTISVYYDENRKNYAINNIARTISITRKLDNFNKSGENILKIDVDYNVILNDILNEKKEDNLYVCNKDYILFSNTKLDVFTKNFDKVDSIKPQKIQMKDLFKFRAVNETWDILITANEVNPLSTILERKEIFLGLIIFNLLMPTIIIILVSHSIGYRVTLLSKYLGKVENEEFSTITYNSGKDEIGTLIRSYNLMVLRIKELIEVVFREDAEKKTLQLAKKQAELRALQSQVNPHFLFNTLETIRMRSLIKEENETAEIIEKLSIMLRKTINWGDDYITIEDEMNFVDNYVKIQKYRFGDKLSYNFYIMDNCKKIKIPKLSILTFVENSCVHGIEEVSHNAGISVSIFKDQYDLYIEISDTGKGIPKEKLKNLRQAVNDCNMEKLNNTMSIGMLNAYLRMKMYFNSICFEIDSEEKRGTDITIKISIDVLKKGELL